MPKYSINWFKVYTRTGIIEVEAEGEEEACDKFGEICGDLEGHIELTDWGIDTIVEKEEADVT